jgi:MFS family permease
MLLALLCVGIFLVQLDVTVVNVALPSIRTDLSTTLAGQQWVVDGYMLALAALLLVFGALGDRIGQASGARWVGCVWPCLVGLWAGADCRGTGRSQSSAGRSSALSGGVRSS